MTLRLNGATSGYTEIDAPAIAGSNTLVLPDGNGTNGQILGTDGSGNLSWVGGRMVLETAKASTSGTSVDFTGIPSWVKKITVMFNGVSTNGTSSFLIQLGTASGVESTGYAGGSVLAGNASTSIGNVSTSGILVPSAAAVNTIHGVIGIFLVSSNTWVASGSIALSNTAFSGTTASSKTLSGTLTQVRITTVNGTDTFDAGSLNLLLEG